jgi:hypothetical protein
MFQAPWSPGRLLGRWTQGPQQRPGSHYGAVVVEPTRSARNTLPRQFSWATLRDAPVASSSVSRLSLRDLGPARNYPGIGRRRAGKPTSTWCQRANSMARRGRLPLW